MKMPKKAKKLNKTMMMYNSKTIIITTMQPREYARFCAILHCALGSALRRSTASALAQGAVPRHNIHYMIIKYLYM